MSTLAQRKLTVDEFLAWAEGREGRWELHDGVPYQMAPERTRHGTVNFAVQLTLFRAIRKAGVPCHMLPDSSGIRISRHMMHYLRQADGPPLKAVVREGSLMLSPPGIEVSVAELLAVA